MPRDNIEEAAQRLKQVGQHIGKGMKAIVTAAFEGIPLSPPDPIFNLNTSFKADTDKRKINVGVGAYRTNEGQPWVLPAVRKAEKLVLEDSSLDHEYLPIAGLPEFTEASTRLVLGSDSPAIAAKRYATVQGISGTGSLRLCAAFLARFKPEAQVYISNPTWAPHRTIFVDSGLVVKEYQYWDPARRGVNFEAVVSCLKGAPNGSVFVLHACAHNPTGSDPSRGQWQEMAEIIKSKGHLPLFDCAYQGFASGSLDEDAWAVRYFVDLRIPLFIAQSYSKNFGLYGERCGALVSVCDSAEQAQAVKSQLCRLQRAIISNPPAFGARLVTKILTDASLYDEWLRNLSAMVNRIKTMRRTLYDELGSLGTPGTWDHVIEQIGMFSYTGLNMAQSHEMRDRFHIYMTDNGRISIAGLTTENLKYFAQSMDWVVRNVN